MNLSFEPWTACWNRNARTVAGSSSHFRLIVAPSTVPMKARDEALSRGAVRRPIRGRVPRCV